MPYGVPCRFLSSLPARALDLDFRIVIRDTALRVAHTSLKKHVSFGPMNLNIAACDVRDSASAAHLAHFASHYDALAIGYANLSSVFLAHQNIVAHSASQRVAAFMNYAVELLAATC